MSPGVSKPQGSIDRFCRPCSGGCTCSSRRPSMAYACLLAIMIAACAQDRGAHIGGSIARGTGAMSLWCFERIRSPLRPGCAYPILSCSLSRSLLCAPRCRGSAPRRRCSSTLLHSRPASCLRRVASRHSFGLLYGVRYYCCNRGFAVQLVCTRPTFSPLSMDHHGGPSRL
jgi:hypothetical protein